MALSSSQAGGREGAGVKRAPSSAVAKGLKRRQFYQLYFLGLLLIYCTLFYYFGEIVEFFGWAALRWEFFYGVHDVHRLFFFAPILFAAHTMGIKGSLIITIVSAGIMMPRALFISPYPDPLLRMLLSVAIGGALGYVTARSRLETRRRRRLEVKLQAEKENLTHILENLADGVVIVGPDYRIRFMNAPMMRSFGEGVGSHCYKVFFGSDSPCAPDCPLPDVMGGAVQKRRCTLLDGASYDIVASPFNDVDGMVCQLATYRDASGVLSASIQLPQPH